LNLNDIVTDGDDTACQTNCAVMKFKKPEYVCDEGVTSCTYNKYERNRMIYFGFKENTGRQIDLAEEWLVRSSTYI
jgi:hypothetical protein